jgi:hypothetical protein
VEVKAVAMDGGWFIGQAIGHQIHDLETSAALRFEVVDGNFVA